MTVQQHLETALLDVVGPVLGEAGFTAAGTTWRRCDEAGNWAVVNFEFSTATDALHCTIGLAVAPAPWLAWMAEWLGAPPQAVHESIGLYRARLNPSGTPAGTDGGWEVQDGPDVAVAADDIVRQLTGHALPLLIGLLDRDAFLATIRARDLGMIRPEQFPGLFSFAEAVLLADDGPSTELDRLLEVALAEAPEGSKQGAASFAAWIRVRAATAG